MKTALCLYGQPRFFQQTYKYFYRHLIEGLKADVYFHTWWSEDMVGSLYPSRARAVLSDEDMLVKEDIPDRLVAIYSPINYEMDDYNILKEQYRKPNYYQYYTQWQVGQLIRERYDLIIRSRFDLMCTQDLEFIPDNHVWVPSCCPYQDRVNDMFSISNHDNFLRLAETYLNLEEFEKEGKGEMEWALISQIKKEKLTIKKFQADYNTFDILRSETAKQYKI